LITETKLQAPHPRPFASSGCAKSRPPPAIPAWRIQPSTTAISAGLSVSDGIDLQVAHQSTRPWNQFRSDVHSAGFSQGRCAEGAGATGGFEFTPAGAFTAAATASPSNAFRQPASHFILGCKALATTASRRETMADFHSFKSN
jgi:hypothetical protein